MSTRWESRLLAVLLSVVAIVVALAGFAELERVVRQVDAAVSAVDR